MIIISPTYAYHYELERLAALFYPLECHHTEETASSEEDWLQADIQKLPQGFSVEIILNRGAIREHIEKMLPLSEEEYVLQELILAKQVYLLLSRVTGEHPKWGVLTGIRPVKLIGRALEEGIAKDKLELAFVEKRCLAPEKFKLAYQTHLCEEEILARSTPDSFSLYVGIPFCPSRCSYCSFVSQGVEQAKKLIEPYLDLLCEELRYTGAMVQQLGIQLRTIYIGGGTPTTLTAPQLERLMGAIRNNFNVTQAWEYTVEAGRADTIERDKLEVLYRMGATRISINPQTFNDEILQGIGRKHTGQDTIDKYQMAREVGFDNINMDIIAGLPQEDLPSFQRTIETLLKLAPENITVHTLSIKRSAELNDENAVQLLEQADLANKMVDYSQIILTREGYIPYYLYRQKNMLGNLENTGFSRQGKEGLYNVYIMDEVHTILSCGASGVTKVRLPNSKKLERIFNFKFPYEYIRRFDEILCRKGKVKELYEADYI